VDSKIRIESCESSQARVIEVSSVAAPGEV
jgi:hypothetical protein